jgi:hypothetical protein
MTKFSALLVVITATLKEDMKHYIGTKRVNAKPMTRGEYNNFRGWALPEDENPSDEGYLVEYIDGGLANTLTYNGYVSWSPSEVFDNAYRNVSGLTFGEALEVLKSGFYVARSGWNGKGMWISMVPKHNLSTLEASTLPYLVINYPAKLDGSRGDVCPWLASQTDILAEDWYMV